MELDTGFDMGICQKLLIVTIVALDSDPSSQNVLGQFVWIRRSPNLRKPRILIETENTCNAICSRVHRMSIQNHFSGPFL